MSPKARRLVQSVTNAVKRARIDPKEAVEALLACAAGLAVKAGTHECPAFFDMVHEMYHSAEHAGVRPVAIAKEPTSVN